jgi:hypothetical protein
MSVVVEPTTDIRTSSRPDSRERANSRVPDWASKRVIALYQEGKQLIIADLRERDIADPSRLDLHGVTSSNQVEIGVDGKLRRRSGGSDAENNPVRMAIRKEAEQNPGSYLRNAAAMFTTLNALGLPLAE